MFIDIQIALKCYSKDAVDLDREQVDLSLAVLLQEGSLNIVASAEPIKNYITHKNSSMNLPWPK